MTTTGKCFWCDKAVVELCDWCASCHECCICDWEHPTAVLARLPYWVDSVEDDGQLIMKLADTPLVRR